MSHEHPERTRAAWSRLGWAALIAVAATVAVWPALSGTWLWDDALELAQNPDVARQGGLGQIWFAPQHPDYFPIKTTLQWLAWRAWGDDPAPYRVLNLVLHIGSALLVWRLLSRLRVPAPWFGGLLFAVHPLTIESVAWIAEFKNTVSLPPLLLSACAYIDFSTRGGRRRYWTAFGWFVVSLLCKTSGVMLPGVLLLFNWWREGRVSWRDLRRTLPFFGVALVLGAVTVHFQHARAVGETVLPIGGVGERVAVAGRALAFYAGKFLLPFPLVPVYPQWPLAPLGLADFLPWAGLAALAACAWRGRRTWGRHVILGGGAFVLLASPVLGFVAMSYMMYSWVSDHFIYLPMLGLVGLATAAVGWGWEQARGGGRVLARGGAAAMLALLLLLSWRHARVFRNEIALWTHTLRFNPTAWVAYNNIGSELQREGRLVEARRALETAVAGDPAFALARNNLGVVLGRLGDLGDALAQLREAARLRPHVAAIRTNLATHLMQAGQADEAIEQFHAALALDPGLALTRGNLATALFKLGRLEEARAEMLRAVADDPRYVGGFNSLGRIEIRLGRIEDAIAHYQKAVERAPEHAGFQADLGYALLVAGRTTEARGHLEAALRIDPTHVDAHTNLGGLLLQLGDLAGAAQHLEAALRLAPGDTEARRNLDLVRARQK
jgi:tetratricopeptide (TPR) repeat protein